MSTITTPAEVATGFITAFGNGDLPAIADYLADDVVFESPRVKIVGAQAVREAVVVYDMTTGPFGTLRAVDYLKVRDGKITSDVLVFDTYEVRMAQEVRAASS